MIMIGQARRLSQPLRWGRRERVAVALLVSCLVLVAAGLVAYAITSGSRARADCVEVTFASTVGGATLHACGSRAMHVCGSGAFHGIEHELRAACRRAGFPFRASSGPR
jgi:hypothetical protein